MRLFTTNGMDVKGMKGYTNLPNRMSRDGPQRKLGFSLPVGFINIAKNFQQMRQ
jgi:hypothetical protein